MKKFAITLGIVVGLLALVVAGLFCINWGLTVTVTNVGSGTLKSVRVHVTGNSYSLGDLAPGQSASVRVAPKGESSLEVEFVTSDGVSKRLNAGGYFESGYRGEITVDVDESRVVQYKENIHVL